MSQAQQSMPEDEAPIKSSLVAEFIPLHNTDDERISADLKWAFERWNTLCDESTTDLPQWDDTSHKALMPVGRRLMVVLADGDWRRDEFDVIYCGQHVSDFLNQGKPVRYQKMRAENPDFEKNYQDVKTRNGRVFDTRHPELVMKKMEWADMRYVQYQSLILPFMCGDECSYVVHVMEFKLSTGKG